VSAPPDYDRAAVTQALRDLGLQRGDVVFSHTGVGMLGRPAEGLTKEAIGELFLDAFTEVLTDDGGWILPSYTYSYTKGEVFDRERTPPTKAMGLLPETLWSHPFFARSTDPLFSAIGVGAPAYELLFTAGDDDCFGPRSLYALLLEHDAVMVNVGIGSHSALIHHVEQRLGVDYRFPKRFAGTSVIDDVRRETEVVYNVRALDRPDHVPYFMRLDRDARADGATTAVRVGRGEINAIRARDMERLIIAGLTKDPNYLVRGDE
jgi:aminoglycoside 3-N-acetyltransferase